MEKLSEEVQNLLVKIIIPSLVAVSIKIAISSRKTGMTTFNVITSIVIGVGSAYLFSGLIISNFSDDYIPLMIALVTITGEKIGNWIIYRLNIDSFIEALIEKFYKPK